MTTTNLTLLCEILGISAEDITSCRRSGFLVQSRFMVWYFLHCRCGIPISSLSCLFKRSSPSIFRGIRIFKGQMKYHKEVRDRYHEFIKKIEDAECASSGIE